MNANDGVIIVGCLLALGGGIWGACFARLMFVKAGLIAAAGMVCLGLSHSGFGALILESGSTSALIGATMICIGVMTAVMCAAIEEAYRRIVPPPDKRRGFPVQPRPTQAPDESQ